MIDALEPVEQDAQMFRPRNALFYWPLAFASCLASILLVGRVLGKFGV